MNIDQFALPTMVVAAVAGSMLMIAQIVGVFMYDAAEVRQQRAMWLHPHARVYRRRPLITVLVSSHNDADTIRHTLDSILQGNYRNVEVIVVDHGSTDMTKQVVKGYIDMHPKHSIRLVVRRHNQGRHASVLRAMKRHGSGQLVIQLPAGSVVAKEAFAHAAQHFAYDPSLHAITCNEQVGPTLSIVGLLEKYQALLSRRPDKALSAFGWMSHRGRISVCRTDAFTQPSRELRVRYAYNIVVTVPALTSFGATFGHVYRRYVQLLRASVGRQDGMMRMGYAFCSAFVAMSGPLLVAYFLYVALYLHEPTLLLLAIGGLSAFMLTAIGESGQMSLWQKAAYAFGIPMTYALLYLLSFSRLFAAIAAPFAQRLTDEKRAV